MYYMMPEKYILASIGVAAGQSFFAETPTWY